MRPRRRARPRVIELVGPAGSGKSTIAQDLCARDARLHGPISMWGLPLGALLAGAVRLSPYVMRAAMRGCAPTLDALLHMVRLEALRQVVDRAAEQRRALVLDEGPVFALGWLEVFFPANGNRFARRWREETILEWADRLDLVVMLDAANGVLEQRIQTREKDHWAKGRGSDEVHAFSERYRHVLAGLVESLSAVGVTTWTVPTDSHSRQEAAALVSARLEHPANG